MLHENIEHWINVKIHNIPTNVGWTDDKNTINMSKHGVKLSDGIPVICSAKTKRSSQFINNENREFLIGPGNTGLLVVIISYVETGEEIEAIRIISVRKPEKTEVIKYMTPNNQSTADITENSSILLEEDAVLSSWWEYFKNRQDRRKLMNSNKQIDKS